MTDARAQTSPDTHWHIFGLAHDVPDKEVIIPNDRASYDSIRDLIKDRRDWTNHPYILLT